MIDEYVENEMLQQAARIANQFKQSVIDVLKSPAEDWLMWSAAYKVIGNDKKAEADAMKARSKSKHR